MGLGRIAIAIAIGILIVSLSINWHLIQRKRPVVGYFAGLIAIYVSWQVYILQFPSVEECRNSLLNCEWVGIGIIYASGLAIIVAIIFSALSIGMVSYHKKVSLLDLTLANSSIKKTNIQASIFLTLVIATFSGFWVKKGIVTLAQKGVFVRWQSLGKPEHETFPPQEMGEEIIALHSFSTDEIRVETNKNQAYATSVKGCLDRRESGHNCWYSDISNDFPENELNSCELAFWITTPPDTVIYQTQTGRCGGSQLEQSNFVLLDDGSIWVWHHEVNTDSLMTEFIGGISGSIIGLIIGSVVVFIRRSKDV